MSGDRVLDDAGALAANDPSGMLDAVLGLPGQCRDGFRSGREAADLPSGDGVTGMVVCGMGGSGVAGDVVDALYRGRLGVPAVVSKGPELPEFCGKDTLVVASSYSGDTSETLACFEVATGRGCRVVAVTSGGELGRRARERGVAVVPVRAGFQPRAAVGHLAFGLLGALEAMGVIPSLGVEVERVARVLQELGERLGPESPASGNPAKSAAAAIGDRFPVVWGAEGIGAVAATRWRTELNENAKVPAFAGVLPELDHNEVVGWSPGAGERFVLLTLRHPLEHPDVAARFPVSVDVARSSGMLHREVRAEGDTPLSCLMSLLMLGSAVSVYLAALRGVDPTPIDAISRIKRELGG
ncbi:MAG: bifunctional phosphoglucose/phosphomannose isomerase [Actinomycetota bacterium]